MSLLFQAVMCSYIWIMSVGMMGRTTIDSILRPFNNSDRAKPPQRSVSSTPPLARFFGCLESSNFLHATSCFMAEFAEAQNFYVIAIVVAIIYSETQGANFNSASNLESVRLNQDMTFKIAFCVSLPILIIQICLFRMSMDSFYSLVFSTTAIVLSGVPATSSWRIISPETLRTMFSKDRALKECGGGPSLRAFCVDLGGESRFSSEPPYYLAWVTASWGSGIGISAILMGHLWYQKLFRRPLAYSARSTYRLLMNKARTHGSFWMKVLLLLKHILLTARVVMKILLLLLHVALVWLLFCSCLIIAKEVTESLNADTDRSWNLGQVVALLAWIPVLAKYIYMLLCKYLLYSLFIDLY